MRAFLNLNTLGYDVMGRTMSLPAGTDHRHAVLDLVEAGDEVFALDDKTLQLLSVAKGPAYADRRVRDGAEIDVRVVDMLPVARCRPITRAQIRRIVWEHQPDAVLSQSSFRYDA